MHTFGIVLALLLIVFVGGIVPYLLYRNDVRLQAVEDDEVETLGKMFATSSDHADVRTRAVALDLDDELERVYYDDRFNDIVAHA